MAPWTAGRFLFQGCDREKGHRSAAGNLRQRHAAAAGAESTDFRGFLQPVSITGLSETRRQAGILGRGIGRTVPVRVASGAGDSGGGFSPLSGAEIPGLPLPGVF